MILDLVAIAITMGAARLILGISIGLFHAGATRPDKALLSRTNHSVISILTHPSHFLVVILTLVYDTGSRLHELI